MGSRFLFATPTFIGGAASVFDLGGTLLEFNESNTPQQADAIALYQDWTSVGAAIRVALAEFGADENAETTHTPAR